MEAKILSNQIESAQKKVEEQNFVMRKNVLKYDDVMNTQRQVIYEQRRRVLEGDDLSEDVRGWIREVIESVVAEHTMAEFQEEWDLPELITAMDALYGKTGVVLEEIESKDREEIVEEFLEDALDAYAEREESWGEEIARQVERYVILQVVDARWREHLEAMDYLREGVHLRAMAQKDPLVEYRHEGHLMFEQLGREIREEVVSLMFHAQVEPQDIETLQQDDWSDNGDFDYQHESLAGSDAIAAAGSGVTAGEIGGGATAVATQQPRVASEWDKVGRNDPCPCGSGKKYKKCHGA
jgi:preprotein translocase subunit SecA